MNLRYGRRHKVIAEKPEKPIHFDKMCGSVKLLNTLVLTMVPGTKL